MVAPKSGKTHGRKELQAEFFHPHERKASCKSARSTYISGDLTCGSWFGMATCPKPAVDHGFMFGIFWDDYCILTESYILGMA